MESINLVELFAQDPEAADRWAAGEFEEFMPGKVRKRLGIGKDAVYSWMCEHSHPRFAGFQLTTYLVTDKEGRETLRPYVGGLPLELPAVLLATTAPGNVLCQLSLALGNATVNAAVALTWPTVARLVGEAVLPGYEAVYEVLKKHGLTDEATEEILAAVREAIVGATEMEEVVAQDASSTA